MPGRPIEVRCEGPGCIGGRVTCAACGGYGEVLDYNARPPRMVGCRACEERGWIPCSVCEGTGRVTA